MNKRLYVAVVGSRDFSDLEQVRRFVDTLPENAVVVSGGARGVDRTAEAAARARGLLVETSLPNWKRFGRSAGFVRNFANIRRADRVVAFWDRQSRGTAHSIGIARQMNKPLTVVYPDGTADVLIPHE